MNHLIQLDIERRRESERITKEMKIYAKLCEHVAVFKHSPSTTMGISLNRFRCGRAFRTLEEISRSWNKFKKETNSRFFI